MIPVLAITLSLLALASQVGVRATAPDGLAAAKALYAATNYEEALKALSAQDAGPPTGEADKYRALCLLALGRMDEVERLLESLVASDPSFRMSDADVTPRLIVLFQQTRRRLLPGILNDSYTAAKDSFERGRYAEASSQFRTLLTLLADEDAASGEDATVTRDLRGVAERFLDLAETALAEASKVDARAAAVHAPVAPIEAGAVAAAAAFGVLEEEAAIAGVVQQYVRAYSALDAEAVARVFQGENPQPLRAVFDALKSQKIEARNVKIAIDAGGWSATVKLTWVVDAVPKVGNSRKAQMPTTLRLLKLATGEWCIVGRR